MKNYQDILLKLALKAYKKKEVPVSAIIVYKNKIIAKSYNCKNTKNNPFLHAEVICLQKAYKKLKTWNLENCELYVSLEPCDMCKNIIAESRIKNVYYILKKGEITNKYSKTTYEHLFNTNDEKFEDLIKKFFKNLRK